MRTDELGNEAPETLGEYREACLKLADGDERNRAVVFLDERIAASPHGAEEKVLIDDHQMIHLLFPMLFGRKP